jgi:hypothetical protein
MVTIKYLHELEQLDILEGERRSREIIHLHPALLRVLSE